MPLNNLPTALQSVIQTGFLEHGFEKALRAKLGFRAIADREDFPAGIGETISKTRAGLLPAIVTPLAPASNTDLTSGLTPQVFPTERYTLSVQQYAGDAMVNTATSRVAIASVFMQNAMALAEQAARSVDTIAQQTLFNAYMGGHTRILTTLGSPGTTIYVDDLRGFRYVNDSTGVPQTVSTTYPTLITIGADTYTVVGFTPDPTSISTVPGGISGTLTTTTNVSVADGTAGNAVSAATAPSLLRANNRATTNLLQNGDTVTAQMILAAKSQLAANNVPPGDDGLYRGFFDPIQLTGLYADPVFQSFFRGRENSPEYRRGMVAELLGVAIVETSLNPVQALTGVGTVRRGIVAGKGALVEAQFTRTSYADAMSMVDDPMITVVDGIAHVTREPIDALKQVVTQAWSYIGGFVTPTDITANPLTLPTASNAVYKRAVVLESL